MCLRFEGEAIRLTSFASEIPMDAGVVEWIPGSMRRGAIRRNSEGSGSGSGILNASGMLFVPTPRLLAIREWTLMLLSAKRSVLIIGESGVGKSRLLEDVSATMERTERFDTRHLSIDDHTGSASVLQVIESGLPRKMRGLYCPLAGKKALVVVVENLHLDVEPSQLHQVSHSLSRNATEVLRQVCDSKGSFVSASKEFVVFRDVVFGASFSLSPFGYPRLLSRFLRHVHPIWFPDPSRDVCQTLLSSYSGELESRCSMEESTIQRICRLPVEIFFSIRKNLKPAPFAPYLLLSLNDVLLTLSRIMTGAGRKVETARDLEIFVLHSTYLLYRNRAMTKHELARIQEIHCDVATKLEFSSASLDVIRNSHEYMFVDFGESDGFYFTVEKHQVDADFVDQIKAPIIEAGVKATHMLLYFDCDVLSEDERGILMHLMEHHDLPHHLYTSADKAKILAFEHQLRVFQHSHTRRPSISSFFDDLTTVTSTRDGLLPLRDIADVGRQNVTSSAVSPRKKSVYRDNLRRCLFIALSFGSSPAFFRHVQNHPSLYYRAAVKTFRPMTADSLEAIYNECLGSLSSLNDVLARASVSKDARHDLRSLMVAIHDDVQVHRQPSSGNMDNRPGATRSQFEEFLRIFKVFFLFQRKKTAESVKALQNSLRLLDSDRHIASEQLEKSAGNELLLEDAAKAVTKSSEQLREYEAAERDAKRSFLLDEQRCSALQVEIEEERNQIQKELNHILPDVAKATDALSQINKYHITEMKSFVNPPQLVRLAMQAVCVLLGAPPTWTEALRVLADIHFLDRLRNFDKDRVDISLIERVKLYVNHPDFSMENMKRASIAATTLCKWVLSIVRYFEVMRRVAPTQKKLAETERQFQLIDDMVRAERQKLVDLELKLNELRVEHARNLQRELEWQRNHDGKMRWKAEVQHYADVVSEWIEILTHELNVVKTQQFRLVGDCSIFAGMLAYTSEMSYQDRTKTVQRWQALAGRHLNGRPTRTSAAVASTSGPEPDAFLQRWHISGRMLKTDIQRVIMGRRINDQQALAVNLVMMDQVGKVCFKYPLLLDPLGAVSNWIKKRGTLTVADTTVGSTEPTRGKRDAVDVASTSLPSADSDQPKPITTINRQSSAVGAAHFIVVVADAADPNIVAAIEKRITVKTPQLILIENAADCLETQFHTLLDLAALAKKKGGHNIVFSTRTLGDMPTWRPKVWGQLSVINCTPDAAEIENQLTTLLAHRFAPTLEKDLDAVCKGYVTEKARLRQVMQSFIDFLQTVQSDREVNASVVPDGLGAEGNTLQEHEMGRISRFLEEYIATRDKFTSVKTRWNRLRQHRDEYRNIARCCATFCSAERLVKNCMKHLKLSWPVSTVLQKIEDAVKVESSARRASIAPSLDITNTAVADAVTQRITHQFVSGRLLALPVWLHRPYKFAVAFITAQTKGEIDATAFESLIAKEFSSAKGVSKRQHHRRSSMDQYGVTHPVRQIATRFVFATIDAAIRSVSGCTGCCESPLSAELVALRERVEVGFLNVMAKNRDASARVSLLRASLHHDLEQHPEIWQDYMRDPTIGIETGGDEFLGADHETRGSLLPEWIRQLSVMERLCLHVSVFGLANSVAQVDASIQHYLGLSQSCFKARSLEHVVNHTASQTPVVVHHQSAVQVSVPSSQLMALARTLGIRDDMITNISLPSADTASEKTREISGLRTIKESAVSGGWLIVQHIERASVSIANTIRHQLQSLQDMGASPHVDYRLWLLQDAVPRVHQANQSLELPSPGRNPYLSDLSTHFFNEHPQSLQEHYEAHRLEDRLRREHLDKLHTLHQQQQGLPTSHQSTRRALELTKRQSSSAPLNTTSATASEQLSIQVALWLFHSISQRFVGTASPLERRSLPNDIIISHFELERAYHAIQLHQRLRMVASTMTSVAGINSPTQALSPMNEWRSMYELASAVYSNRLGHVHFTRLCKELLATCLTPTSQNGPSDHDTSSNRPSQWQSQLATVKELFSQQDSGMSLFTEHDLIPDSLHRWISKNVCEAALRVGVIEAPGTQATTTELIALAQRIAKQLMTQLPSKTSLLMGIEHQEHQRRASAILTWRKNRERTARGVDEASNAVDRRPEAFPRWNVALSEHLLQTELPAMEKHLRHVWDVTEMLVALKADPFTSIAPTSSSFQDFAALLEAVSRRQVPPSWRSGNGAGSTKTRALPGSAGYTSPSRLRPWVKWLHRAVTFYQRVFSSPQLPRLPDVLWLPALRHPTACLFSLRCSVAVERDVHVDDLVFVIESRDAAAERSGKSRSSSAILASFALAGLVLWNASWSTELHALEETVTRRHRARDVLSPASNRDDAATPVASAFTEALPVFDVSLVHRPKPQPPSTSQFSCPVFRSFQSKQRFEDPVVYLVTPTVDRASTFVACDVAMFLTDDMDA
ncbi:hypothetical protein PINS_up000674 [Pythium insidiosum]|nr:hypothetical protein PINS_up000674 [Pythium insidiosum]